MTTEETALADKILKEATEADPTQRADILDQYYRLIAAAMGRREATEPRQTWGATATQPAAG